MIASVLPDHFLSEDVLVVCSNCAEDDDVLFLSLEGVNRVDLDESVEVLVD